MKLSEQGIGFLKHAEGFRPCVYEDAGKYAIGYGCQVDPDVWRDVSITEAQAETLMKARLREHEAAVNEAVKVPIAQHVFDSLAIFSFNVGAPAFRGSTLVRRLNAGKVLEAADQFLRWVYSGGKFDKPNNALEARRKLERRIFLGETVENYNEE